MSEINDGGPAFPSHGSMGEVVQEGMSLRAYFAIHEPMDPNEYIGFRLAERLTGRSMPVTRDGLPADPLEVALFWADAEARYRYMRADAMLAARNATRAAMESQE